MAEEYTPSCILITGAAGFIASNVACHLTLKYRNYRIVVLDKLDYCASIKNLAEVMGLPNFKFIKGDITSADLVNYVLEAENIDTVMHFAAQSHVDNSFGNSLIFTHNNVVGTHVLLEAVKQRGNAVRRFIHVSTDEVYGENKEGEDVQFHESATFDPTNPYAATKACAEMLVKAYAQSYKLPLIVTRGNNVYGPKQFPEKLIPKFLHLAMDNQKLPIHGAGGQRRSYMHVDDVSTAFETILHKGKIGEVYNIASQQEFTVLDVARDICELFKLNPDTQIDYVEDRLFNDQRYFVDASKLLALGWEQKTMWKDGLASTAEWYKTHENHWSDVSFALRAHPSLNATSTGSSLNIVSNASACNFLKAETQVNEKDEFRLLIFGRTGWLGGLLGDICREKGITYAYAMCRMEDRSSVKAELDRVKPTHVLNAAGVTGRPNVDWCESHKKETIRANVIGTLNLADLCSLANIHLTNFATGCIFEYDAEHPMGSGIGFKEEDTPNFTGSYYSNTKAKVEDMLKAYDNVLNLRVRMPISENLEHPRNFIYKISRYAKVVNIPNSMTVLPEMLPIGIEMARRKLTGIYNFTNPGVVSHNEILEMYKEYYKPDFKWENFTLEEQAKILAAPRSNNELDTTKIKKEFPELLPIKESLMKYVFGVQTKQTPSA